MNRLPRIVILGAGYGGIVTAIRLQKELNYNEADVTLVNKHDYHYITTHLHMPAAGTDDPKNARINILNVIDEFKIDFVKATVKEIRPHERKIVLDEGVLSYDYLVIGLGGEPETFGIPGLKDYAMSIRSINSVNLIREHIEYQFAKFKQEPHRREYLTFVVGGAGFTGIEFVAELAERIPKLCKKFDVDPEWTQIYSIEAAPTILPGFDQELVDYARQTLEQNGVKFIIGTPIRECHPDSIILADGTEIRTATIVWTGGIRGNSLLEKAGFEVTRGRIQVDPYLRIPGHDNIFVVGDCSIFMSPEGKPYPPTAQIAMQMGYNCAHNLVATIRNESMREFRYEHKGVVASLGKRNAIGVVGNRKLKGYRAALLKKLIDIRYLYMIGGIPLVIRKARF